MRAKWRLIGGILILGILVFGAVGWAQPTIVKVDPATQNVLPGAAFQVGIYIDDVTNMAADGAILHFDPSAMQATGITAGVISTFPIETIDNTAGTVTVAYALMAGSYTGSGMMATIAFTADPSASGTSNLTLPVGCGDPVSGVCLLDGDVNEIPCTSKDGTVTFSRPSEVWVDDDYTTATPGWGYDHFDKIQDGIDAVEGSTVNVAAGTYQENVLVNKQLTLIGDPSTPSNVVVDAQGTGTRPIKITADGCTLRGFKTINSETTFGSIGVWSDNNTIKDNIASDNSGSTGIFVYGASYNTIENNNVSNNGKWGINLYSKWVGSGYVACENNTIKNNIANNNGQEGIGSGAHANNNTIEDNQVNDNTFSGIGLIAGCSGNTIKNNTVNGNGAIGINFAGTTADHCTNNTIIGNTVNNNGGDANILLSGYCDNSTVENNTANNGHYGIRVSGDDNTIKNNTANNNSEHGMRLKGDNYTIEDNTCNSNAYGGIWLGGSEVTNSIVKNNTLHNNNGAGILLWTCHTSNLTGNTITNNTYGIKIASGSPDNSINFNNIAGNGLYGVINEGTTEVDAEQNWWGDASGPSTSPGLGDKVSANVDYEPWLLSEWPSTETEETESETIDGSGTMEDTPTGGDVTIDATGDHTITTAKYTENPGGAATFTATGDYYDVHLDTDAGVNSLTVEFCPATPTTVIYYWDGTSWARASDQTYANGCITVTITATTLPSLSDLTGLAFGSGSALALGDINNDGYIDVLDARLCLQIATGFITPTAAQEAAADVDGDGDVDLDDAKILAEYIIGIRTTFPGGG